jgi:hypothetical protein
MINWSYIAKGIEYYQSLGYEYREVPWIIGKEAIDVTLPPGRIPFKVDEENFLVGSAEQSFV